MIFSQNARAALKAACRPLSPAELPLPSIAQDRMALKDIVSKAERKGLVPFNHARLEELLVKYEKGFLSAPGPGAWVLVATDWQNGFFTLEFRVLPPAPQAVVLESVNYTSNTISHFGLKHNFLFDRA